MPLKPHILAIAFALTSPAMAQPTAERTIPIARQRRPLSSGKRGATYLRTLLIHGARSVLRYAVGKTAAQSQWLQELIARRGYNRAAVALANKNARVIQVLRSRDVPYHPSAAVH
jgi:hypothetical protein